ncbi:MAG: FRG domain-containing protein [Rhodospirillales bacterium]|nr:FRG domain-containing protein [Rhodospirillales bacterium]
MPKVTEVRPKNLPEYLARIEALQRSAKRPLWFRGVGNRQHKLVPSIYRHPAINGQKAFQDLETELMTRFRQRSIPYHSRSLDNDWEALFFMQHYGVPTRLLDWTENPFTALHFAMMAARLTTPKAGKPQYVADAAVWVLDPVAWNRAALSDMSYTGGALTPGNEALNGYSPRASATAMNALPVAMYGAHNSARIVAQQGVFAIFGADRTPMDTLIQNGRIPADALICVVIPARRITTLRRSILNHGITESVVFPDLEGLARETKRHFGFEA